MDGTWQYFGKVGEACHPVRATVSSLPFFLRSEVRLVISDSILHEVLRVLRTKFHQSDERVAQAEAYITGCSKRVFPARSLAVVEKDPDDDRILECAVEGLCEWIER